MDGKVGKKDMFCVGLEIAFYSLIVLAVVLFLAVMLQVLVAEERQRLVIWPLAVMVATSLACLGCCWVVQGKILKECGRER